MFEMSDRFPSVLTESEDEAYSRNSRLNVDQVIPQTAAALEQKIVLPRGSGQCRFEPQPYYYLASKSGPVGLSIKPQRQSRWPLEFVI